MAKISGGKKLKAALDKIAVSLGKGGTVKVGFLAGATYPNGTPVAMVAAIQNFGAPKVGIPPRPFFSNMVKDKSPGWPDAIALNLKATDYNVEQTLGLVGAGIEGQLQQSIIDTNTPALSPVTVMLRGMKSNNSSLVVTGATVAEARRRVALGMTNYGASTKPLVDDGHMLNSTGNEVKT